jgi:hypothetical protein
VSPSELIDKITILRIKEERITDIAKRSHVQTELTLLEDVRQRSIRPSAELSGLEAELKAVNEILWQVEDDLRRYERDQDFGPRFVELARSVYRHNDRRAGLKRQINELLGARFSEQKSYSAGVPATDGERPSSN